jgi:DNA invertase Pin-like site-specific DNA recombinase
MPYLYGYARKSPDPHRREDDPPENTSVAVQTQLIETAAPNYPDHEYVCTFGDDDVSAVKVRWRDREGFNELLQVLQRKDIVLVTNYDRIERGGIMRAWSALEYLDRLGVKCISLSAADRESLDEADAELMHSFDFHMARKWAQMIARRTSEALQHRSAKGYRLSRFPPLGYDFREVPGKTRRGKPQMKEYPNEDRIGLFIYRVWLPILRGDKTFRSVSEELDREIQERVNNKLSADHLRPQKGRKWIRIDEHGRLRTSYAEGVFRLFNRLLREGKTEYGGVAIPRLTGKKQPIASPSAPVSLPKSP